MTGGPFEKAQLDGSDVLCFLALASRSDVELDPLPLVKRAIAIALDVRVVDEDVIALVT